ncbi:FAD-dependent oxidoreductase [Fluviibacterium sp. DFM31]|uniref:FAD-dependent oxidoreductase n=1 Tax=Meridianimarinicoccus marinus TaxID=3231483 RepID=A0ABV3L793_9RHOB
MTIASITIHGAGIFGLSVAYFCLKKGARVTVVDPGGVGAGASGGLVGALSPHTPENWNPKKAFQFESLIMAAPFWDDVARLSGRDPGYGRVGRLQPLADARAVQLARMRQETAAALWQGKAVWEVIEADLAGAWAPRSATGLLIRDTLSARLHPRQGCAALAAAIVALGGEITEAAPVGQDVTVLATGYTGLLDLSQELGVPVGSGVKGQGALLDLDRAGAPQIFAEGVHVVPHGDGTVAVGSTSEREFDAATTTDAQLDAVLETAIRVCPVLNGVPVLARWAGVRPRARSRAPMLGAHPIRPASFIANGGFKIGFGVAPKVGQVMADLILEGVDAIPEGFRVSDNL